ncbi:thiamine pyrophosphate-binding protein [Nocardia donostiensis]|uniref:acetolactate synthase n=1 Tax=Nocardia donostiensis TaxID=1538463 RepID=A0A1W0AT34_9NOCA|nr:thiamine pyrophosphate-binding protein [Nocardia donostiensis]ONM49918.1 acetolactate synthase [Nocardia donostiensis]OQS13388.1 acetolactate synthase [Nocardia donostiensis]OQS22132.1 acetolactate synthase [Nocardia donostiensis]
MPRLNGGQVIARILKQYGVPYVAGIPGHGIWGLMDAFLEEESNIPFIQTYHEQSAVHLADGYYRVSGKPMAAVTSIGAGASNTVLGLATAYSDSTSVLVITGGPPRHMRGRGILQELDRQKDNGFPQVAEAVSKRSWVANSIEELPFIMHRAFSTMLTGRRGPAHIEVPYDLHAETAEVSLHDLAHRLPVGLQYPDPQAVERATRLLACAERPIIVVGGGAISANATDEVLALAEALSIPVVTTWNGKSAFPEDHELFVGSVGQTGTIHGNYLAANADVVLSVGCRFTDWSASSYTRGKSFSFPPAKLIHIDIDPHEIGKNYPTEVGIVADAKPTVAAIVDSLPPARPDRSAYLAEIAERKADWEEQLSARRDTDRFPFTLQRPLGALRSVMDRSGIVLVGSGNTQGAVKQTFPVYEPRTHLTTGGFSSMGWPVPAAIGAKLAAPDRQVACIVGDGDFLMTAQEIGVAVQHEIPVVFVVQDNSGYISIRGGQKQATDRHIGTEFNRTDGSPYSPSFKDLGKSFGLESFRVDSPAELESTFRKAFDSKGPALVEVPTDRDLASPFVPGWLDFPPLPHITDERQDEYRRLRGNEQHI